MRKSCTHARRALLALAIALVGGLLETAPAWAFGPGNSAWDAYYAAPTNQSTWGPFCAGGGGQVVVSGDGVPACGRTGKTPIYIPPASSGDVTPGFQCVELSERFLYVTRHWASISPADGAQVAEDYAAAHRAPLIKNGTVGVAPHIGDVMSFSNTSDFSDEGHTGVVTASEVNSSGTGSITLLSENVGIPVGDGTGDSSTFQVVDWTVQPVFGFQYSEWVQSGSSLSDGTFIRVAGTNTVFRMAGGAPLYVHSWAPFGGRQYVEVISQAQFNKLARVPTNGTFIRDIVTHQVFRIAGGAPTYVGSWAPFGGKQPHVNVDDWDLQNITNPLAHLNAVPAGGTFVRGIPSGRIYRIAGGALFHVSAWAIFGGRQPYVNIDDWDIDNRSDHLAHLNPAPLDKTVVEGIPSDTFWTFAAGYRIETEPTPGAVSVDDTGLQAYPVKCSRCT